MQLSILNYKPNLVKYIFSLYLHFLKFLLSLLVYLSQHYLIFFVWHFVEQTILALRSEQRKVLEDFEDTKGVIRIRKSRKNRQHKRVTLSCIVTDRYNQQPSLYYTFCLYLHAWIFEIVENDKETMELTPGKHTALADSGILICTGFTLI